MKTFVSFLFLSLFFVQFNFAQTFESDGIYYNITSTSPNHKVEVTTDPVGYSGHIIIPSFVNYEDTEYMVNGIGFKAFTNVTGWDISVEIPSTVTYIADSAFYDCPISELILPNFLETIGNYAFSLSGLNTIQIPDGVYSLGAYSFESCFYLYSATIGNSVTQIEDGMFNYCQQLQLIQLPANLLGIGEYAFGGCEMLSNVSVPNSVDDIGVGAFNGCWSLTNFTIPDSLTYISDGTFSGCSQLSSMIIPNTITSIGEHAFSHCFNLDTITLSNSITEIKEYSFWSCGFESVEIPSSVKRIGRNAFWQNDLLSIEIPDSVTYIGPQAFGSCYDVRTIKIGTSVDTIGGNAFFGSIDLEYVICCQAVPPINLGAFEYHDGNPGDHVSLIVPEESMTLYENAYNWQELFVTDFAGALPTPQICLVTVNDEQKNEIIWEKPDTELIQSYRIFKENSITENYDLIGEISYNSICSFVDINSQPDNYSYRYKIASVGPCGQESDQSDFHQTILLNISESSNQNHLTWEPYIGVSAISIKILRGNSPENLEIIADLGPDVTEFYDEVPLLGTNYYRVQITLENQCTPSKTYSSILSNIVSDICIEKFEYLISSNLFYPNPAKDNIYFNNHNEIFNVTIYDLNGRLILNEGNVNSKSLDISILNSGVYKIVVQQNNINYIMKLVKE